MRGWRRRAGVVGFVVVLGGLATAWAQEARGPAREVLDLVRESAAGKDTAARAAALGKKFGNVRVAMRLYNPRSRGGIGLGSRGTGIERRLLTLEEDGIPPAALPKEAAELVRVAHLNLVVAEITRGFAPEKPFQGRGRKEWERDIEGMKTASRKLLEAVQAGDAKAVQAAVVRINAACTRCHEAAR